MKRFMEATAVCAILCAAACSDSEPIALFGPQTLTVDFRMIASVKEYNVWDFYRDGTTDISGNGSIGPEDVDGVPDDVTGDGVPDIFLVCQESGVTLADRTVPWPFSVEISVLRAGATEPEVIHDPLFSTTFGSLSKYDTSPAGNLGQAAPTFAVPSPHRVYTNPRKLLQGNRTLIEAPRKPDPTVDTPLSPGDDPIDPSNPNRDYCPFGVQLGDANTGGVAPPFPVELGGGDTLIVKARKANTSAVLFSTSPSMIADIRLDGEVLETTGVCSSGSSAGAGFTCSYTSR